MSNTTLDTMTVVAGVYGAGVLGGIVPGGPAAGKPAAGIRFARRIR